jgi:glycerophosphoryl diester phosphodiesterase
LWSDAIYWSTQTDYKNAVALEGRSKSYFASWSKDQIKALFMDLKNAGVPIVSPPMQIMVNRANATAPMEVSNYAAAAREMGFTLVGWSFERDGPLQNGGGGYHQGLYPTNDGFDYEYLDFMVQQVGIVGLFSDWPASVTFYANCMGIGM